MFQGDTGVVSLGKRVRSAVALVVLAITLASCSTMQRSEGGITRDFAWRYGGQTYQVALDLHAATYEGFRHRERTRDYDLFASDYHSKPFIEKITRKLAEHGTASGLSKAQIPYLIVSFVQNLPYTSDDVTTGYDEYPRYPYETLYDNGGDCEDTSILASAMLHELRRWVTSGVNSAPDSIINPGCAAPAAGASAARGGPAVALQPCVWVGPLRDALGDRPATRPGWLSRT